MYPRLNALYPPLWCAGDNSRPLQTITHNREHPQHQCCRTVPLRAVANVTCAIVTITITITVTVTPLHTHGDGESEIDRTKGCYAGKIQCAG
jgi:hypothetical protein